MLKGPRTALMILALAAPGLAQAWGRQGHQTIALVAEAYLTPAARQWVERARRAPGWQDLKPGDSRYFRSADEEFAPILPGP